MLTWHQKLWTSLKNTCINKTLQTVDNRTLDNFTVATTMRVTAFLEKLQDKSKFSCIQTVTVLLQTLLSLAYTKLFQSSRKILNCSWTKPSHISHFSAMSELKLQHSDGQQWHDRLDELQRHSSIDATHIGAGGREWQSPFTYTLKFLMERVMNRKKFLKLKTQVVWYKKALWIVLDKPRIVTISSFEHEQPYLTLLQ